jgi:hypothetical protein
MKAFNEKRQCSGHALRDEPELITRSMRLPKAAGGVLTAKQAPHRPDIAPALGLRAGCDVSPFQRRPFTKETTMWYYSFFNRLNSRPSVAGARRSRGRSPCRLLVEELEARCVPAPLSDPVGDFLPTYPGPQNPGLDVTAHEAVLLEDQQCPVFYGRMAVRRVRSPRAVPGERSLHRAAPARNEVLSQAACSWVGRC